MAAMACLVLASLAAIPTRADMGHTLHGIGPVNLSMGGTGVALPTDPMSALAWNPALITAHPGRQLEVALVVLQDQATLASTTPTASGKQDSGIGLTPIPNVAYIHAAPESRWAFGFGAFGISGVATDYPADGSNPITTPPPVGFGRVSSEYMVLQAVPTVAYKLSDRLSIGFAPTLNFGSLKAEPWTPGAPFAPGVYPSGSGGAKSLGAGAQIGVHYATGNWHFGLSYKTEQWFQEYEFSARDGLGERLHIVLNHPAIASLGVGYRGDNNWDWAIEARYIDYENAEIWGDPAVFDADGALTGFGASSIWYLGAGVQYRVNEKLSLRAGYAFAESPIESDVAFVFGDAPMIIKHHISAGLSYEPIDSWVFSLSVHHGFKNEVTGPIRTPAGIAPGLTITLGNAITGVGLGVTKRF